jgi:hypothetical protein
VVKYADAVMQMEASGRGALPARRPATAFWHARTAHAKNDGGLNRSVHHSGSIDPEVRVAFTSELEDEL